MNAPPKPPGSVWELILNWVNAKLGTKGVAVLLAIAAFGSAAWNWESIASNSLYESVRAEYFADPLPLIESSGINILVANLHGDIGHKFKKRLTIELIPEKLPAGRSPIKVYPVDRYIRGSKVEVFSRLEEGREKARELLRATRADLVVWGSLEGIDKSLTPVIFVTASGERYSKVNSGSDIKIPSTEKTDMLKLLRIVALAEWAQLEKEDGTAINENFIRQVTTTFQALQLFSRDAGAAKIEADTIVARSKARIGRAYDNPLLLKQALDVLQPLASSQVQDLSIKTDIELGLGLSYFGLADIDPERYTHQDAMDHYQAALKIADDGGDTRRKVQALIGVAGSYLALYQRSKSEDALQQAARHAQKALDLTDPSQYAGDWGRAAQTLAVARRTQGEANRDLVLVQDAIDLLQKVLKLRDKLIVPVFWANTKNALGNGWSGKAAMTEVDADFRAAMDHYRGAIEVFDSERFPLMNATVTMNLALVEESFWKHTHDEDVKRSAKDHFEVARTVFLRLNRVDRAKQAAEGITRLARPQPVAGQATELVETVPVISEAVGEKRAKVESISVGDPRREKLEPASKKPQLKRK